MQNPQLFQALSPQGLALLADLEKAAENLDPQIEGDWSPEFQKVMEEIEALAPPDSFTGHGATVTAEDAARNGSLVQLDESGVTPVHLLAAVTRITEGKAVLVGGAGVGYETFLDDAVEFMLACQSPPPIVALYVGLDQQHWVLPGAVPLVEVNLLKIAAMQLVNSATNRHWAQAGSDMRSVIVSESFSAWVVNRALQAVPRDLVRYAMNMQIDGFGPIEAMRELITVKWGAYGQICNIHTNEGLAQEAPKFGVTAEMARKLPVDLTIKLDS